MKWVIYGPNAAEVVERMRLSMGNDPDIVLSGSGPNDCTFDCPDLELQSNQFQYDVKHTIEGLTALGFTVLEVHE